ncbi:hypothetical protein [Deinococcus budaensis]|uniref:Lipopolysaccharide export system protein LptA n=1 Tax=Deinococcus budaensis TaxID=1665626 RepID=A0A7W8GCQ9_9DEIO|nr:hypothetical protein [Deinococcus budaensis]MBB5233054.1 lipopolysaccharide export system protein LptA [Deinococcus budaensis]
MNRLLPSLLAALTLGTAGAVTFGGLNVTPRGPQNLNLETGATDFPQGGTVTDGRSGLRLQAGQLQLQPGQRLSAQGATLTTRQGGTLRAANVVYDLAQGTVTATGDVTYTDARLKNLTAGRMVLHVKTGFVSAHGGVRAGTPALNAAALAFDPRTAQTVLAGPARLSQGTRTLEADQGGHLLLTFSANRLLRAASRTDAATLGRFAPYLK